jgi:lipoprotein-releasing system permease protein
MIKNKNIILFSVGLFLAWKTLIKNKKKLVLTLFIISLGFISSIIVYGAIKDTTEKLQENFINTAFGDIVLEPNKYTKISNSNNILKKIESIPDVVGYASINKQSARLYDSKGKFIEKEIWIVDPLDFSKATLIENFLNEGDYLTKDGNHEIFMGCLNIESCSRFPETISNIDVFVGKEVKIDFGNNILESYNLVGNYKHHFSYVENVILISKNSYKLLYPEFDFDSSELIIIRLDNKEKIKQVTNELAYLGVNSKINTYKEKLALYIEVTDSFNVVGHLSFLIGVIISAISVYIILYINALHRKVQIGIMRAIGIKSAVIKLSYTIQGFIYGILGSILGIILTYLMIIFFKFYPLVTAVGDLVPTVTARVYVQVALAIIIASTLTGYIVSRNIIRLNIINSIRNV